MLTGTEQYPSGGPAQEPEYTVWDHKGRHGPQADHSQLDTVTFPSILGAHRYPEALSLRISRASISLKQDHFSSIPFKGMEAARIVEMA